MYCNDFEKAFSDFLDCQEYDQAEGALFTMARIAFIAGWKAAGGHPPEMKKLSQVRDDWRKRIHCEIYEE